MKTINRQILVIFILVLGMISFARAIVVHRPMVVHIVSLSRVVAEPSPTKSIYLGNKYIKTKVLQHKQSYNVASMFWYYPVYMRVLNNKTNITTIGPTIENAKEIKRCDLNQDITILIFCICFIIGGVTAFFYCRKNYIGRLSKY